MPTPTIHIEVEGLEYLEQNMEGFSKQINRLGELAGDDIAREILDTEGLRKYPPATEANAPGRIKTVTFGNGKIANFRMSYYIRGRGMMDPVRGAGFRQTGSSERYGTQFTTKPISMGVEIANRASYAKYLASDNQAGAMAGLGWRKLYDVAVEKLPKINAIFQEWVNKIIRDLGLS